MSHTLTLDHDQLRILETALATHIEQAELLRDQIRDAVLERWSDKCRLKIVGATSDPETTQGPEIELTTMADGLKAWVDGGIIELSQGVEIPAAAPEVLVEQPFGTGMALNLLKREPETVVPEAAPEAPATPEVQYPHEVSPDDDVVDALRLAVPATPVVPVTKKSLEKAVSKDPGEISMAGLGVGLPKASERKAKPLKAQGIDAMVDKFKRDYPSFGDIPIPKRFWNAKYTPAQLIKCIRSLVTGVPARQASEDSQLDVAEARAIAVNWCDIVTVLKGLTGPKRIAALDDLEAIQKARVSRGLPA